MPSTSNLSGFPGNPLVGYASITVFILSIGCALAFIPPEQKILRASFLAVSVAAAAQLQNPDYKISNNCVLNGFLLTWICSVLLRAFELLLLRNVHVSGKIYDVPQENNLSKSLLTSKVSRLLDAMYLPTSTRYIGTPWVIEKVPSFSKTDSAYIPSRSEFLRKHAIAIILTYLLIDLTTVIPPPDADVLFPAEKQVIFSRPSDVTLEEIISRAVSVFFHWLVAYCYITVISSTCAVISVSLNHSHPRSWPPRFGSFTDMYTVRRFWGESWHQMMRNFLVPISDFLSTSVLCIPKGTLVSRYTKITFAFLISGVIHVFLDIEYGGSAWESGAIRFFVMQAVGIIVEDAVQEIYLRGGGKSNVWSRGVGYAWTVFFLCWTTPSWEWVAMRRLIPRSDKRLPFSVLASLGVKL